MIKMYPLCHTIQADHLAKLGAQSVTYDKIPQTDYCIICAVIIIIFGVVFLSKAEETVREHARTIMDTIPITYNCTETQMDECLNPGGCS